MTEDHSILLLDDEMDEFFGIRNTKTYVWDITGLNNPVLKSTFYSEKTAADHNQYIVGDLVFQVITYFVT